MIKDYLKEKYSDLPLYVFTDENGEKEYWSFVELEAIRFDETEMKWRNSCLNKMWVEGICEVVK